VEIFDEEERALLQRQIDRITFVDEDSFRANDGGDLNLVERG